MNYWVYIVLHDFVDYETVEDIVFVDLYIVVVDNDVVN